MDKAKTGALIAAARKEKNLTQRELAAALHVSDRAISKWERGLSYTERHDIKQHPHAYTLPHIPSNLSPAGDHSDAIPTGTSFQVPTRPPARELHGAGPTSDPVLHPAARDHPGPTRGGPPISQATQQATL